MSHIHHSHDAHPQQNSLGVVRSITRTYSIVAVRCADASCAVAICGPFTSSAEFVTRTDNPPLPVVASFRPIDADVTDMLKLSGREREGAFAIDRTSAKCLTPRRNADVDSCLDAFLRLMEWGRAISGHFTPGPVKDAEIAQPLACIADQVFVPVLPILRPGAASGDNASQLTLGDISRLEEYHRASLDTNLSRVDAMFPAGGVALKKDALIGAVEARLVALCVHLQGIAHAACECAG